MYLIDLDKDTIDAEVLDAFGVAMENFQLALGTSNPSNLRESIVEISITTRNNVGGLDKVKQETIFTYHVSC